MKFNKYNFLDKIYSYQNILGLRPQKHFTELISPGTGIFYDPEQSAIVCCARKGQPPPSLHNIFCVNPSTCKMKEHKLYRVRSTF